jgi:hypothetical protein
MTASEKEVAFRKRRREYAVNKPKNAIRTGTTIIEIKQPRFYRAETIPMSGQAVKADKRKFSINRKCRKSPNFPQRHLDSPIFEKGKEENQGSIGSGSETIRRCNVKYRQNTVDKEGRWSH